jgi:diguanylate cyclase (GGDEF)-like protein
MAAKSVPTIAFLLDMLYEDYAIEAWRWAIEASEKLGTSIIAFTGGNLKQEDAENKLRNDVYRLISPDSVDAIVSLSASLATTVGTADLLGFFGRYKPLPVAHIGIQADGIAFFRADGYTSTKAEVQHLIDVHGKREIAYVSGPENVMDSDERYRGYRDALAERGIEFDPGLVYRGDFYRETGERAVKALLDERHRRFDALVSANDYMAVFAIRELTSRGMHVPADVAVVGYDDIQISRDCSPPLTTVRQPIRDLMNKAFLAAVNAARGDAPFEPEGVVVPSEVVLRRSCGCSSLVTDAPFQSGIDPESIDSFDVQTGFDEAWKAIEEAETSECSFPELFVRVLSSLVTHGASSADIARPLAALVQAEIERRTDRERQLREDDALMQRITGEMLGATSANRLGRGLDRVFERAGLRYYLIAEYQDGRSKALVVKSSEKGWEGQVFIPRRLAPYPVDVPSLVVLPLYVGDESLGFFVTEGLPCRPSILELIREHLSATILAKRDEARERSRAAELERLVADRTADLKLALAEVEKARDKVERISFTDELTGLHNRRGFLMMAERELQLRVREGGELTLAFIDVDGLKGVNDNYGHAAGDCLIKSMAEVLKRGFRETDIVARLGGDEFTVLAVDCGKRDLPMLNQRLASSLETVNRSSGKPFRLAYSIGMAFSSEFETLKVEDLMKLADLRLYDQKQGKSSGRGA